MHSSPLNSLGMPCTSFGTCWDAIGLLLFFLGSAFGPLWGALGRPWTLFGSFWISLDPFGVSLDQLRISQPQVVMKEALHSFPQARTQSHSFETHWRALQSFTEPFGCRTCMQAKNSFADPHSNRLLQTSRTLDRNCVLHGVVFTILLWRLDRHTNDANKTF